MILSPSLSTLSAAGGLKKYKSKIISFLLLSGKESGHFIVVITLLSVILNIHKAIGISLKSSEFNERIFLDFDLKSTKGRGWQSSPSAVVHSLLIETIPLYILE